MAVVEDALPACDVGQRPSNGRPSLKRGDFSWQEVTVGIIIIISSDITAFEPGTIVSLLVEHVN